MRLIEYRRICLWVLVLCCSFVANAAGEPVATDAPVPSVDEVYRRFIESNGGHANILAINTLVLSAQMSWVDQEGVVEFKLYRKRPGMMRMRWNMPTHYVETVFDGEKGWRQITSVDSGDIQRNQLQGEELKELQLESSIVGPFFTIGRNPGCIDSIQHDSVNGSPAFRLEINPEAPVLYSTVWLDQATFQEVKLARMRTLQGSDQKVLEEVVLSEMDRISGVYFSRRMEYFHDGERLKTIEVERIRVNVGLFDSFFSLK